MCGFLALLGLSIAKSYLGIPIPSPAAPFADLFMSDLKSSVNTVLCISGKQEGKAAYSEECKAGDCDIRHYDCNTGKLIKFEVCTEQTNQNNRGKCETRCDVVATENKDDCKRYDN